MIAFTVVVLVLSIISLDINGAGSSPSEAPLLSFPSWSYYPDCDTETDGLGNYTRVDASSATCDVSTTVEVPVQLIQTLDDKGHAVVNTMQNLARANYPNGAYRQRESLYLVTGGPLEGKYVYFRSSVHEFDYLKKCSSVLGHSYVVSKSALMLIIEKINVHTLYAIASGNAYDVLKRICIAECYGTRYFI